MSIFLESPHFPASKVSEESAREKAGGGRPDHWEMVFWWTRKPLISARSIIVGSLLDVERGEKEFTRITRLDSEKTPHRENPIIPPSLKERFSKIRLLDPFAGFGSIPLEAIRLGIGEVVALEFLPTAYVFLKAVLEIPKWAVERGLGRKLIEDVKKWGEWVLERLKEDPDIKELYNEDVAVYIGTWEVRCPFCGRYTPLIGNYWLARVKERSEGYERLVWMEPVSVGERIEIKIIDLNKEFSTKRIQAKVSENVIKINEREYIVPEANIDARSSLARCLHCNRIMPGKGDQWYVKQALQEWNNRLEKYLNGEISLEELRQSPARPRLLVKVRIVNKELEFEPAKLEDDEKLWKALEKLKTLWGDPDIPAEFLPIYENRSIWVIVYGFDKWYKHFNPRQLITLVKLVKLIREAGKRVEEEKLKQGWNREDASKYAEAVTTYLAMALCKYVNYYSLATRWHSGLLIPGESLSVRGIAMMWNWTDSAPYAPFTGTWLRSLQNMDEGLSYLINAVSGSSSRVRVLLDDATSLSKLADEKFDLIVTDPPYKDDVPYAELSDFYYVWLKRTLSDVKNNVLVSRFYPEAFFECLDDRCSSYIEIRTQWEKYAPHEISVSSGRADFFRKIIGVEAGSDEDFREKLGKAFKRMAELTKDDGMIVTYYAHTDPSAWEALVEAGWKKAGLKVSAAYVIATESEQRVTARGKVALDASVVVVWRKGSGGVGFVQEVENKAFEEALRRVDEALKIGSPLDINLFLKSLAGVLSVYTSYSKLVPDISVKEIVERSFSLALKALVEAVYKRGGVEKPLDPYSSAYVALKLVTRAGEEKAKARGRELKIEFRRGRVDKTFASLLGVFSNINVDILIANKILAKKGDELELLEPEPDSLTEQSIRRALENLLHEKNLDPSKPENFRTAVDALHYLELKAIQLTSDQFKKLFEDLRSRNLRFSEAIDLAKVLHAALPDNDPEKIGCKRILQHLNMISLGGLR